MTYYVMVKSIPAKFDIFNLIFYNVGIYYPKQSTEKKLIMEQRLKQLINWK